MFGIIILSGGDGMPNFGDNLKKAREKNNLTQQALADKLYVTRQAVSRWENNARYPDIITLKKISNILNISVDKLLCEEDISIYENLKKSASHKKLTILLSVYLILSLPYMIPYIMEWLNMLLISNMTIYYSYYILNFFINLGVAILFLIYNIKHRLNHKNIKLLLIIYFSANVINPIILFFDRGLFNGYIIAVSMSFNIMFYVLCVIAINRFFVKDNNRSPVLLYFCFLIDFLKAFSTFIQMITVVNNNIFIPAENSMTLFVLIWITRLFLAFLKFTIFFYITYCYSRHQFDTDI